MAGERATSLRHHGYFQFNRTYREHQLRIQLLESRVGPAVLEGRTGTLDGSDDGTGNALSIDQSDGTLLLIFINTPTTPKPPTSFTMTMTNTSAD